MLPLLWLELLETRTVPSRSSVGPFLSARLDTPQALASVVARLFAPDAPLSPSDTLPPRANVLATPDRPAAAPPIEPYLLPPDNGTDHARYDAPKRWADDREAVSSLLNMLQSETATGSNAGESGFTVGASSESSGPAIANANEGAAVAPVQTGSASSATSAVVDFTPLDLSPGDADAVALARSAALADAVFLGVWSEPVPPLQTEMIPAANRDLTVLPAYLASNPVPVAPATVRPTSDAATDLTNFITGNVEPRHALPAPSLAANPPQAPPPVVAVAELLPPPATGDADTGDVMPPTEAPSDADGDGACPCVPADSVVPDGAAGDD